MFPERIVSSHAVTALISTVGLRSSRGTCTMTNLNEILSCVFQIFVKRQARIRFRRIDDEFHEIDIDEQRSLCDSALKTREQILRSRAEASSSSSQRTAVQHWFTLFWKVTPFPDSFGFLFKEKKFEELHCPY